VEVTELGPRCKSQYYLLPLFFCAHLVPSGPLTVKAVAGKKAKHTPLGFLEWILQNN